MAFKISAVFLLLVVCQMCLSARLPRDVETTNVSSSSEDSSEEFDRISKDFEQMLSAKEKEDFQKLVTETKNAKTLEDSLGGVLNILIFAIEVSQNKTEPLVKEALNTTTQITSNSL